MHMHDKNQSALFVPATVRKAQGDSTALINTAQQLQIIKSLCSYHGCNGSASADPLKRHDCMQQPAILS